MWIIIISLAALGFIIFLSFRIAGRGRFPWLQFYTKGKESGFTFREINLMRHVAVENRLENPTALFWSIKTLDRSIKELILKLRSRNLIDDEESNHLLHKLFELRKRVEFDLPRYKLGLRSTRDIAARQRMKISLPGLSPFLTMLIENHHRYMALAYPKGENLPPGFTWKRQQIGIHFWRTDDAGYFFKTKVLEDYKDRKYPIIHAAHSDDLIRTQKRKSVRVPMNHHAMVYPLRSIQEANEFSEQSRGLRCRIRDISEDGAALLVGGRTKVGLPLKFQFEISDRMLVMCGIVKGLNYNAKKNVSILHIQAVPLSLTARNHLLTYIYDLFGEREKAQA